MRRTPREQFLSVRLTGAEKDKIDRLARRRGFSTSQLVRDEIVGEILRTENTGHRFLSPKQISIIIWHAQRVRSRLGECGPSAAALADLLAELEKIIGQSEIA